MLKLFISTKPSDGDTQIFQEFLFEINDVIRRPTGSSYEIGEFQNNLSDAQRSHRGAIIERFQVFLSSEEKNKKKLVNHLNEHKSAHRFTHLVQ